MAELLERLRRAPERMLHPVRRRRALARLMAGPPPRRVLVVCSGNIFRSPFAAAVLRRLLGPAVDVSSAGFMGPGRRPPADAIAAATARGVDLSGHRSDLVSAELVRGADLIVAMEPGQRRLICDHFGRAPRDVLLLGDLDPQPITCREIEDPVEQPPRVCERVYARIERCARELASGLRARRAAGAP